MRPQSELSDPALGASRLEGLFEPDSPGGGSGTPASAGASGAAVTATGELALGDINVLCLLLDRIAGADA